MATTLAKLDSFTKMLYNYIIEQFLQEVDVLQQALNNMVNKINEQKPFMKTSIYIMMGFLLLVAGYGFGRLLGWLFI